MSRTKRFTPPIRDMNADLSYLPDHMENAIKLLKREHIRLYGIRHGWSFNLLARAVQEGVLVVSDWGVSYGGSGAYVGYTGYRSYWVSFNNGHTLSTNMWMYPDSLATRRQLNKAFGTAF